MQLSKLEERKMEEQHLTIPQIRRRNVALVSKVHKIKMSAMGKACGISESTMTSNFLRDISEPSDRTMKALTDAFKVAEGFFDELRVESDIDDLMVPAPPRRGRKQRSDSKTGEEVKGRDAMRKVVIEVGDTRIETKLSQSRAAAVLSLIINEIT